MIDPARNAFALPTPASPSVQGKAVFRMTGSDRMAGSVPAWVRPVSAQEETLSALGAASDPRFADELKNTLSYREPDPIAPGNINDEPFGFGDLVDIVNPLQHIPLVSHLYRKLTGDQIRPSSSIIGGAVFGGVAGAAGSLANVIIKKESGRDVTEHALHLAGVDGGDAPVQKQKDQHPLQQLANIDQPPALPQSALGFLDMTYNTPHAARAAITTPHNTQTTARVAAMYKFNA